MTPDGTPLVGPSPIPGLWLNTGHGTLGWTMAAGSGQLLSDLISGNTPDISDEGLTLARYGWRWHRLCKFCEKEGVPGTPLSCPWLRRHRVASSLVTPGFRARGEQGRHHVGLSDDAHQLLPSTTGMWCSPRRRRPPPDRRGLVAPRRLHLPGHQIRDLLLLGASFALGW